MVLGVVLFTIAGTMEGMDLGTSIFDGLNFSMSGYGTGGFAPHSQSVLFYHSALYEIIVVIIFLLGSFNFSFHYAVLGGKRREIFKNTEIRTFFVTMTLSTLIIAGLLLFSGVYSSPEILFRKAFFQAASAHTATGFGTVYPAQISVMWPSAALLIMAMAMMLGTCANSTGGGIKAIRVGIIAKSFVREVKKALSPGSAVVTAKFHHVDDVPLTDTIARGAMLIALGYVLLLITGTTITMLHGYGATESVYESASAVANVGLSSGITTPTMPATLKVTYIILMWAGRLEITAVLVLIGFVLLGIRRGIRR
jgi:trk system potassium uptake protein TrkH